MEELISRQAAIDAAIEAVDDWDGRTNIGRQKRIEKYINALLSAEPKRGKWIKKHRHYGGFRSYTGFDSMGEKHTVIVDERGEYDDLYCSECGARSADNFLNFCPKCGSYNGGEINDQ